MWASLRWSTAAPAIARPGGRGMAAAGRRGRRGGCAPFRRRVLRCTPVALFSRKKCSRGSEDYGTFCVSSKLSFTFAVFPGSTVIGSGVGGFVLYMPSEEPAGGDDCASHFPVGSYARGFGTKVGQKGGAEKSHRQYTRRVSLAGRSRTAPDLRKHRYLSHAKTAKTHHPNVPRTHFERRAIAGHRHCAGSRHNAPRSSPGSRGQR